MRRLGYCTMEGFPKKLKSSQNKTLYSRHSYNCYLCKDIIKRRRRY